MKVLLASTNWQGLFIQHTGRAFELNKCEVKYAFFPLNKHIYKKLKLTQITRINNYVQNKLYNNYNENVIEVAKEYKPDILFIFSAGGQLLPETVAFIQNNLKCITVCYVGDNPFDSSRDKYVAMTLQYYDYIFIGEKSWIKNIRNIAPKAKIFRSMGGYNPEYFYPIEKDTIKSKDKEKYQCELSFTGSNYGEGAEGSYRAGILNQLNEFDLRIWGYGNWPFRFKYYPNLKKMYKGDSLSWNDLRKLYTLCKINLNMPSPQIFTGFQPRLFDIAATKGFQIVDDREELHEYFTDDEIVTFKDIPDLKDKIHYYLAHPEKRKEKVEKLYKKVVNNFTWEKQIKKILNIINA